MSPDRCPAGHRSAASTASRPCRVCRRQAVLAAVLVADPHLPPERAAAALDATLTSPAVLRNLAAALAADPDALGTGAPPVIGRLIAALRAAGSTLPAPACAVCARTNRPLSRADGRGLCGRCRHRELAEACLRCGVVKPVAARDGEGRACCARCADRPQRSCGRCGRVRRIARRARDGAPDICDGCFRMPEATCSRCQRRRPCSFAAGPGPVCTACAPRPATACAHCGAQRPPSAHWPEGPVCDPCYTAALRRRGRCTGCGATRRLIHPPGSAATRCADCVGRALAGHVCTDCGVENKLYERGRCASCALRRRTAELFAVPATSTAVELGGVRDAIAASPAPRSALNWLRDGAGAALLADLAAGRVPATHQALDAHPQRRAADYLRQLLVAHQVLPARDEALTRAERRITARVGELAAPEHRRVAAAYATWRVLRRLRRRAEHATRPRTPTNAAEQHVRAAVDFLDWLTDRGTTLAELTQADLDQWLSGGPARHRVRDLLGWAVEHGHAPPLTVPPATRVVGVGTDEDERWKLLRRLLHDDSIDTTDRVAGALLLAYGQQLSRITAITRDQVTRRDGHVGLRLGRGDDIHVPEPLAGLLLRLLTEGRRYVGVGAPAHTDWLFPGLLPGRPLSPAQLGVRLRRLGVYAIAGRRATLTQLGAELPAAVLADLLDLSPTTAVRWVRDGGGDWSRYAAQLARDHGHN